MLSVESLTISVALPRGQRGIVVDDVSFAVPASGSIGIVGESGSGKTMTSLAIMGLLPPAARVESGRILLDGENLLAKSAREMQRIRGIRIGMIPQDPMTALDPLFTLRSQLAEPMQQHRKLRGVGLDQAIATALEQVQLAATKERLDQYPHQLSGGMRQRAISAIALAGQPQVLIADEPTSALDATTQARYLQLLQRLQRDTHVALVLVAHDLLVVKHVCEHVIVMYAGQVVEEGRVADVFSLPEHPYTRALLGAIPTPGHRLTLESIDGEAPEPGVQVPGCRFASRCRYALPVCVESQPILSPRGEERRARCFGTEQGGWVTSG